VEVNRTEQDRNDYVAYLTNRLQGRSAVTDAPPSFGSRVAAVPTETDVIAYKPRFYGPGRRVITYRTRAEIPPVLIANGQLKRVEIAEVGGSPFRKDLILVDDMPSSYIQPDAYAVSYVVNPDTEITRSDILFEQGTTNFADAYSYDVVVDLAMALKDPSLSSQAFIIEGHASAEGDYAANLRLSQARAERIAREMIRFGVSSSQLVPVGYGESEAVYASAAADPLRAQDRRVTVFALQN
jgi:outer membrane protein OmpA-like peptidoglycan-associated protein